MLSNSTMFMCGADPTPGGAVCELARFASFASAMSSLTLVAGIEVCPSSAWLIRTMPVIGAKSFSSSYGELALAVERRIDGEGPGLGHQQRSSAVRAPPCASRLIAPSTGGASAVFDHHLLAPSFW